MFNLNQQHNSSPPVPLSFTHNKYVSVIFDNPANELGVDYDFIPITPSDNLQDVFLPKLKGVDAIVIGYGVRGNTDLTYFLEQIVDITRVNFPHIRFLFNTSPPDTVDAVKRWYKI
eukprot:TRINITY_DN4251_c0_g1_i1.p1 TRINITY_DN4251_c0_g1~~TRINITY_DN4251_c0_g1_i1.p1  ORF type:complete len:116 (+),score=10.30 TRINITY_DN4251_c0_g1_i1:114-461(+)